MTAWEGIDALPTSGGPALDFEVYCCPNFEQLEEECSRPSFLAKLGLEGRKRGWNTSSAMVVRNLRCIFAGRRLESGDGMPSSAG